MKHLAALAALTLAAACVPRQPTVYNGSQPSPATRGTPGPGVAAGPITTPTLFPIDHTTSYLLDPLSQSCTLIRVLMAYADGAAVAVAVDCVTLAANHRDLAAVIHWARPTAPAAPAATPSTAP